LALGPVIIADSIQVRFTTRCNIPFLASSGQHGFNTELAELQNGMEINLSAFRNVLVDAEKNILTVGGGVRFMDVFGLVFNTDKEISTFRKTPRLKEPAKLTIKWAPDLEPVSA
jgi:hypothetical protein